MSERLTPEREAEIAAALSAFQSHPNLGFACCSAHPVAEAVPALLAELTAVRAELEAERQESTPIPACWDRTVILPEHPNGDSDGDTIVCCIADDGRPIGLFLNDEHREALGLLLVDPDSDTEEAAR